MPEYKSRVEVGAAGALGTAGGDADVEFMRHLENVGDVATLEQRWSNSWAISLQTRCVKVFLLYRIQCITHCSFTAI
jgi:dynactin-4